MKEKNNGINLCQKLVDAGTATYTRHCHFSVNAKCVSVRCENVSIETTLAAPKMPTRLPPTPTTTSTSCRMLKMRIIEDNFLS